VILLSKRRAFHNQGVDALHKGLEVGPNPVYSLRIPWAIFFLPAYLVPPEGRAAEVRPLIIFNNGYDATMTNIYFASAVAAARHGYHSLAR
jgi:hypothetical protein